MFAIFIMYGLAGAQLLTGKHQLIVIAHRGDHTAAPENTIRAFKDAIAAGVDYVEVDLRTTRDGELVVMHDASVDRMTNAKGLVKDLSLSDLRKAIVVDKQRPQLGEHRIPTFAEVLEACSGKTGIYLDFKDGDVRKVLQLLQKWKMTHKVIVYINHPDQLSEWRTHAPAIPLMVSLPDSVRDAASYAAFSKSAGVEYLDGDYSDYTAALVSVIQAAGQHVWVDVQSKDEGPDVWEKVLSLGVEGMQTDHPRELIRWKKSH